MSVDYLCVRKAKPSFFFLKSNNKVQWNENEHLFDFPHCPCPLAYLATNPLYRTCHVMLYYYYVELESLYWKESPFKKKKKLKISCVCHRRVRKEKKLGQLLFTFYLNFFVECWFLSVSLSLSLYRSPLAPADLWRIFFNELRVPPKWSKTKNKPSPMPSGSFQRHPFRTRLITWEIFFLLHLNNNKKNEFAPLSEDSSLSSCVPCLFDFSISPFSFGPSSFLFSFLII